MVQRVEDEVGAPVGSAVPSDLLAAAVIATSPTWPFNWRWAPALAAAAGLAVAVVAPWRDDAGAAILRPDDLQVVLAGRDLCVKQRDELPWRKLERQPDGRAPGQDDSLPAPPHHATGHKWHHTDQVLFDLTKHGVAAFVELDHDSAMPAFEVLLSDKEIVAVFSCIKSRWPESIRRHDKMNALERN